MDKKEIEQLLNATIEAHHAYGETKQARKKWLENHLEPEYKHAYESIDDFLRFEDEYQSFNDRYDEVCNEFSLAIKIRDSVKKQFDLHLPSLVWFKVGDHGVGLGYDEEYRTFIMVEPWSDNMPELDHTEEK